MKRVLLAVATALSVISPASHSGEAIAYQGVIRFVGSIVRAPCDLPATTWYQHVGRINGASPTHAGAVPAPSNDCAGIADTYSISTQNVSSAGSTSQAEIMTVTFN